MSECVFTVHFKGELIDTLTLEQARSGARDEISMCRDAGDSESERTVRRTLRALEALEVGEDYSVDGGGDGDWLWTRTQ